MPAAKRPTIPPVKRVSTQERAEACHNEQIRLKEEAAERRAAAAERSKDGGR